MSQTKAWKIIATAGLGTVSEWYDFTIFAYFTVVLAPLFFPFESKTSALMTTYGVFALGFLARPVGALLLSHIGDRFGRKKSLVIAMILMASSTTLIGLLPTYHTIGYFAPVLLTLLRMIQGMSVGGEMIGSATWVLESFEKNRYGFMGALLWSTVSLGVLLGSGAVTLTTVSLSHDALYSWGWRVPFLLGAVTGIVGYYARIKLPESNEFIQAQTQNKILKYPLRESFLFYRKEIWTIAGIYALSATVSYIVFIFMPTYMGTIINAAFSKEVYLFNTLAYACLALLIPVVGYYSDYFNKKRCMLVGAVGFLLFSYPLYIAIAKGTLALFIFAQFSFVIFAALLQGPIIAATLEMLPTPVRFSVAATGYNLSNSLFGAAAPFVATYLVYLTGYKPAPGFFLILMAMLAIIALRQMSSVTQAAIITKSLSFPFFQRGR